MSEAPSGSIAFLSGGGKAADMIRARDWSSHPLGPPGRWPDALRVALSLVLNSPESMILCWGPELFFFFNDAYFPMLGPRLSWATGARFDQVWADGLEQALPIIDDAMSGRSRRFVDLPWKLGTDRGEANTWWTFSYSRVLDADGAIAGLFILTNETTDRVRSATALRESEGRNRQILDSATDFAIIATDLDGRVTRWNEGARRILGWSEDEMLGETVHRFFTPEDLAKDRVTTEMRNALTTGHGNDERWHQRRGGERFWAVGELTVLRDEQGAGIGFVKVLRDRTEHWQAGEVLRETEARLRESEDHLRHTVELNPAVPWTCDPTGSITSYSQRWLDLTGQRPGEPDGAGWAKALHPDDVDHTTTAFSVCLASGAPIDVVYRIRVAATGEYRWMRARAHPRRDDAGAIVHWYGVVEDVHDRKLAEAQLRESEARFRAFAQAMPNHVWSATPDGELDWVNERALAYGGTKAADNTGDGWTGRLHPDDVAITAERWLAALASGEVYQNEFRLRRADGNYRWHLARAVPIRGAKGSIERWIGTNTDIEDQKAAAEVLAREAEALGQEVNERRRERDRTWALSPVLKVVGSMSSDILAVNPSWTWTLGWTEADTLGRNIMEFVAPEDRTTGAAGLEQIAAGMPVREFPTVFATKAGGRRTIVWTTMFEDGRLYGFGRDITEQRVAEEALRQSQKMEAVGQLTGGLAHDFNNLLTGVSGSLELLGTRVAQGRVNDLGRYIVAAQGASKRAAALTHRLLAFSRRQTLDPKPTDVNRLVVDMADLIRRTVGPEITLEVVGTVGLWTALVDPNQLENALLNLAINARDAMPDGGRLTIETGNRWMDERGGRERDLPPGQYLSICVSDTGTGMAPDVVARAFDPFFTTKPLGQGTGLGLSMIYGFARQSGGQVRIYSEIGEGTMVCVYLPRHYGAEEVAEAPADRADVPRAEVGETVLVVDDEPTVRMLVCDVLSDLGYASIEAEDGPSGLKVLRSEARVDLLVTDVGLPGGMNGRQVADAARALRPGLKVLFITGYAENAALGNGHLDPGMAVLTKPFAMDDLAGKIRALIERRSH